MPGIHRLKHVKSLGAAHFADNDTVGTHPQRIADELALSDLADAFDIGRARLHLHHMWLLKTQFDDVFDRDDPLVGIDVMRHGIQQSRFAGASAA